MMNNEQLKSMYDMLFQLRNSMDKQIRQLQDVQNILVVLEYGFEHIQENNNCEASAVRIMLEYLKELEISLVDHSNQINLIEGLMVESQHTC